MSLTSALHKWRTRSAVERQLLLAAVIRLAWAWTLIRSLRLQRIVTRLHMEAGENRTPLSPDQLAMAASVGRAVVSAAAHTPWRSACLEQALAAASLLRRGGIPGSLYLGIARDAVPQDGRVGQDDRAGQDGMVGHAWLRCGDLVVTGAGGCERFAVVGTFCW